MSSNFNLLITSDIEYNELCVEIFFEDKFVGIVIRNEDLKIWK